MAAPAAAVAPATPKISGLDIAEKLAAARQRDDLVERIHSAREQVEGAEARVVVVGEYKQGKSSLVNALLGSDVCPVDDVRATAVPTVVRYGDDFAAARIGMDVDDRRRLPLRRGRDLRDAVLEPDDPAARAESDTDDDTLAIEIAVPRRLLATGAVLVDTPGVGGLSSAESGVVLSMIDQSDAVLLVSDVTQELTQPEVEFLLEVRRRKANVIIVLTKSDLTVNGARIVERNQVHLTANGLDGIPMVVVSSMLHAFALEHTDDQLELESGFEDLFELLKIRALDTARNRIAGAAAHEIQTVIAQLEMEVEAAERASTGDAEEVATELRAAQQRVTNARAQSARWRGRMAEGFSEIAEQARFDRRQRQLEVGRWVENVLAEEDELDDEAFIDLLYRKIVDSSVAHYDLIQEQIDELVNEVGATYSADSADDMDLRIDATFEPTAIGGGPTRSGQQPGRLRSLLTVAQSSSSGMVIASTAVGASNIGLSALGAGLVGVSAAVAPLIVGAPIGVLLAMRAIRDDRKRRHEVGRVELRRRANSVIQSAWVEFEQDSQRALRQAQQLLKDNIEQRTREVETSLARAAKTAERIGQEQAGGTLSRETAREIARGRETLETMRSQVAELMTDRGGRGR